MYPYYRLQEAGFQPVVAAPEKRRYQMVLHEVKPGWDDHQGVGRLHDPSHVAFSEIREEEYLGIMFSGGRAPEYIRYDPRSDACDEIFLSAELTDRQRMPWGGDPRDRRLRPRPADGHGAQVQIRLGNLRWHVCQ